MTKEERLARALVRLRSEGVCEACGHAPATNFHHRKNRSQGGGWSASNGLDLCGSGTTGCHGEIGSHPLVSYENGRMVRRAFDPADVAVLIAGRGFVFLDDAGNYRVESEAA